MGLITVNDIQFIKEFSLEFGVAIVVIAAIVIVVRLVMNRTPIDPRMANAGRPKAINLTYDQKKVATSSPGGPIRFKISGVEKESQMDVTEYVEAQSSENARAKAELRGVVVTSVERV